MKKKWTDYLSEDVYIRLCECRTIKADIPELVKCKWQRWNILAQKKML